MKPLTIEQLKSLEVGDWVWYVDLRDSNSFYIKKNAMIPSSLCVFLGRNTYYSDYGINWLAYKNKEQAEAKGEIVELRGTCEHCIHNIQRGCYNQGNKPQCEYMNQYLKAADYCSKYEDERDFVELKGEENGKINIT